MVRGCTTVLVQLERDDADADVDYEKVACRIEGDAARTGETSSKAICLPACCSVEWEFGIDPR